MTSEAFNPDGNKLILIEDKKRVKLEKLNIWSANPAFKDISKIYSTSRFIVIYGLIAFIIVLTYFLESNLFFSIGVGIAILFFFIIAFHDQFFIFSHLFSFFFRKNAEIKPFKNFIFWYDKNDPTVLFLSNRKDLVHTGLRIFQINIIPENVHASTTHFIKALSDKELMIPFSYQIAHRPIIASSKENLHSTGSFSTSIFFCTYYYIKGLLTGIKRKKLLYKLNTYTDTMKTNLISDFHHFQIELLSKERLVNALRTFFLKGIDVSSKDTSYTYSIKKNILGFIAKISFLLFIISYLDLLLIQLHVNILYFVLLNGIVLIVFIIMFWRSLLFHHVINSKNSEIVDPVAGVKFYYYREHPDSIFLYVDNRILVDWKMFNLKNCAFPMYTHLNKFMQTILELKIPFTYSLITAPMSFDQFYEEGLKYIRKKIVKKLFPHYIIKDKMKEFVLTNSNKQYEWLGKRAGIWRLIFNISICKIKFIKSYKISHLVEIEELLNREAIKLHNSFRSNFKKFEIIPLRREKLISGIKCELLKNKFFQLDGTRLNYVIIQGSILEMLIRIVDELKKGVHSRIGAEFNSPLFLENFLTIGHVLNTEIMQEEIPAGFLYHQLTNLFITNGTSEDRTVLLMKIISEGIKLDIPFIIFDFYGTWSRLLRYFEGSRHMNNILYFKFGQTFTIDPLHSDIPYDKENIEFINYMLDAYGLAFKKNKREIDMFRTTILNNPNMDLQSLGLETKTQNEWQRSTGNEALLSIFSHLTPQDLTYFRTPIGSEKEKYYCYKFIMNSKSIILDLSIINDYPKQIFLMFLIISKIIHYMSQSSAFTEKIFVMPHVDIFFDAKYIDYRADYGMIDKFLDPIFDNHFGVIFSVNQAHYLHPNIFNYFNNLITLRANDSRDIAILTNLMHLHELKGSGIYSRSRKNTYQFDFLMNLNDEEMIVKRSDIPQPFPIIADLLEFRQLEPISNDILIAHMNNQGYDLKTAEQIIIHQAKETLFEKDLGGYILYLQEIIKFFDAISRIDQVGNLYKDKVIEELSTYLYPKAIEKGIKKENFKKFRDSLFTILLKHGYLKENHLQRASGSESIRTSYSVGSQYQKALADYMAIKGRISNEGANNITRQPAYVPKRAFIIQQGNIKKALSREFSNFMYNVFNINFYIKQERYSVALKVEQSIVELFLMEVYKHYTNTDELVTSQKLESFFEILAKKEGFPYTKEELLSLIGQVQLQVKEDANIQEEAYKRFTLIKKFAHDIKKFFIE